MARHQISIKCMVYQRELGLNPQPDIYTCDCGFNSHYRDKFNSHKKKCASPQLTINNTPINDNNSTQNNHITLNYKMIELFFQRVKNNLSADYLHELCKRGYADLSDQIIANSVNNKNGGSDIRMADFSRQKLMARTITGDIEEDIGARKTGFRIGATIEKVLAWSYGESENSEKLKTMRIVDSDRKNGYPNLRKRILVKCPRTFGEQISSGWARARILASQLEQIVEEADRRRAKEKLKITSDPEEKMVNTSQEQLSPQNKPDINLSTSETGVALPANFKAKIPTFSEGSDSDYEQEDEKDPEPHIKFLSNSKRLDDGRWVCQLREFRNLVFIPVTTRGRDAKVKIRDALLSYRHLNFIGNAIAGIDHIQSLTDEDRKIIEGTGLIHVPMKNTQ
jgi:hypothetical protein